MRSTARGSGHEPAGRLFSFARWWAMVLKEFLQLRRDRITFGMIIGIPIAQLILFGFAINTDPKHMPTAILDADHSEFTRSFIAAMEKSEYFKIAGSCRTRRRAPGAGARRGAVRREHSRRFHPAPAAGRTPGAAGRGGRDGSDGDRDGAELRSTRLARSVAAEEPDRAPRLSGGRVRTPSMCASIACTIPKASPNTTSCRGSWA